MEILELTKDQIVEPRAPDAPALRKSIDAGQMFERPVVRPTKDGKYEVVMGRKRVLETVFHGGYNTVECEVRRDLDDELVAMANLSSNHSHTLNMRVDPWHVKLLLEGSPELGVEPRTQNELAEQTGMSQGKISQLHGVFSLHLGLIQKVKDGLMGVGAVRLAQRLTGEEQATLALKDGKVTGTDVNKVLQARRQAIVEQAGFDIPEQGTLKPESSTPGGLVINGSKLDLLLAGAEVEVEIDGQTLLIQIVGAI